MLAWDTSARANLNFRQTKQPSSKHRQLRAASTAPLQNSGSPRLQQLVTRQSLEYGGHATYVPNAGRNGRSNTPRGVLHESQKVQEPPPPCDCKADKLWLNRLWKLRTLLEMGLHSCGERLTWIREPSYMASSPDASPAAVTSLRFGARELPNGC